MNRYSNLFYYKLNINFNTTFVMTNDEKKSEITNTIGITFKLKTEREKAPQNAIILRTTNRDHYEKLHTFNPQSYLDLCTHTFMVYI